MLLSCSLYSKAHAKDVSMSSRLSRELQNSKNEPWIELCRLQKPTQNANSCLLLCSFMFYSVVLKNCEETAKNSLESNLDIWHVSLLALGMNRRQETKENWNRFFTNKKLQMIGNLKGIHCSRNSSRKPKKAAVEDLLRQQGCCPAMQKLCARIQPATWLATPGLQIIQMG